MNQYEYKVILKVTVEAFDEGDAFEALQDAFGVGETGAVSVAECVYQEKTKKK